VEEENIQYAQVMSGNHPSVSKLYLPLSAVLVINAPSEIHAGI
jgi:hypothetical protein